MSEVKKTIALLVALVVFLPLAGCGKGNPVVPGSKDNLGQIYELHARYVKNHEMPPRTLADLDTKTYQVTDAGAVQLLKEEKYVLVWNVSAKDGGTLLAYEKDAPTQGGEVLMADGTVKKMSAAEVQAAVKK
jgi:hypothetical protein